MCQLLPGQDTRCIQITPKPHKRSLFPFFTHKELIAQAVILCFAFTAPCTWKKDEKWNKTVRKEKRKSAITHFRIQERHKA